MDPHGGIGGRQGIHSTNAIGELLGHHDCWGVVEISAITRKIIHAIDPGIGVRDRHLVVLRLL